MAKITKNALRLSCAAILSFPVAAYAQADEEPIVSGTSSEIIVTAQKRSERLQDVPIAITALDSNRLSNAVALRTEDLASLVPGLAQVVGGSQRNFFLRGVGITASTPGQDAPVATYVDDVYVSSPVAATFLLNSLEQIEVLKGPQGTLFGRNATAGVISYRTRNPSQIPELKADVGYGNYETTSARLYANTPIGENAAANIAVAYENQEEGFGYNFTTNETFKTVRNFAIRGKLQAELSPTTEFRLTAWYDNSRTTQNVPSFKPGLAVSGTVVNPHGVHDSVGGSPYFTKNSGGGIAARLSTEFEFATLTNILAYQTISPFLITDTDFRPPDLVNRTTDWKQTTWTNELQLVSNSGPEDFISWTAGVYLISDRINDHHQVTGGAAVPAGGDLRSNLHARSIAPFAQAEFRLGPDTHLTTGLRYTIETRDYDGTTGTAADPALVTTDTSQTFRKLTYRLALEHNFTPDIMAYASVSRGFKSGSYNMARVANPPVALKPETLDDYEIGLKTSFMDRKLTLNVGGFYYDYSNITARAPIDGASLFDLINAASARIYGADIDFSFQPSSAFNLYGGIEWLHARYRDFPTTTSVVRTPGGGFQSLVIDASGNRIPYAPKFSGSIGASYKYTLDSGSSFTLASDLGFKSRIDFGSDEVAFQPAMALLNGSLKFSLPDDRAWVTLWGRNLLDKTYIAGNVLASSFEVTLYGPPRTVGATLGIKFGG